MYVYIIFLCKEESFYACPRHYHVGPSQIPRARMRRGGRGKAPDGEQLSGTICHRGEPCGIGRANLHVRRALHVVLLQERHLIHVVSSAK